jgi:hypothetical protein
MSKQFDTVQAAAEYGLAASELHQMMQIMYPNQRFHFFIGSGSMKSYDDVMGMPRYMEKEEYKTVRSGWVYHVAASSLAVGDIHTDTNGVTWKVVANVIRRGSAETLGYHVFCAVEVTSD